MKFGPFASFRTGIRKSLSLIKIGINPFFCIAIYLGIIKSHIFNLKYIGKIEIDNSNGELLEYYRCMRYTNEDPKTINRIFKEIISKEDIITIRNIKFNNINKDAVNMFLACFYTDEYSIEDNIGGGGEIR
ncbi:hypothetical protein MBCUT_11500 [Methanobrevibacter cuticularis]|uniref:Uncharacterized protein n=1 Tax=Methanobrevibacter cuticularis TaxID=47311 RepID=A0A166DW48_9EURY|nr:hypothetical protein [Methanobrevibacter cuticularis]KZX16014.1 hypothetical protein MBCUT_11500 [Methanobrevibacter cuticularis]